MRGEFSATVFLSVAAKFEAERRFPRLASQLPATVFPSGVTEFEVDQRLWGAQSSSRQRHFLSLLLALGRIQMDCMRVGLSRGSYSISYVYVDTEWPHNVHADEAGR